MNPVCPPSPDYSSFFNMISIVLTVLTIGLTVVGAYLALVLYGLDARIEKHVRDITAAEREKVLALLRAELAVVDVALEVLTADVPDAVRRTRVYCLRHIFRLASESDDDVKLAIDSLEALGDEASPLLPLAVKVQHAGKWNSANTARFEALLANRRALPGLERVE